MVVNDNLFLIVSLWKLYIYCIKGKKKEKKSHLSLFYKYIYTFAVYLFWWRRREIRQGHFFGCCCCVFLPHLAHHWLAGFDNRPDGRWTVFGFWHIHHVMGSSASSDSRAAAAAHSLSLPPPMYPSQDKQGLITNANADAAIQRVRVSYEKNPGVRPL